MAFKELKKRLNYFREIFNDAEVTSEKDNDYSEYLKLLENLINTSNEIYDNNSGQMTAKSHAELARMYFDLNQQARNYIQRHRNEVNSPAMKKRMAAMVHFNEYIEHDINMLDRMGLEHNIPFSPSRTLKVDISNSGHIESIVHDHSVKIPVTTPDGRKGFFIPKTDAGLNREWEKFIGDLKKDCPEEYRKNLDKLLKDYSKRQEILENLKNQPSPQNIAELGIKLGIAANAQEFESILQSAPALKNTLTTLISEGSKLSKGLEFSAAAGMNNSSRTDNRMAAVYDVARFLGCEDVVEKAIPMELISGKDKILGTFIETPEELDEAGKHPEGTEVDIKGSSQQNRLHRQLSNMKVLDYICGNAGRGKDNISYQLDDGHPPKIASIKGSDNTRSFVGKPLEEVDGSALGAEVPSLSSIKSMDKNTLEALQRLDRKTLEAILRAHALSEAEIEAAWKRTEELKQHATNNFNNMYIIPNSWAYGFYQNDSEAFFKEMEDFLSSLDRVRTSLSEDFDYNKGAHVTRASEINVADKKISRISSILDSMGNSLDDDERFRSMKISLGNLQKMSGEIIEFFGSDAPDKKEQLDRKYYQYEQELNVFKLHTAEYLHGQQNQLSASAGNKNAEEAVRKKIDVAEKLQEKVQKIQDDMTEAFNAEMRAEVARIIEAAKQAEQQKKAEAEKNNSNDNEKQSGGPESKDSGPGNQNDNQNQYKNEEMQQPEIKGPELGDRFQKH